MTREEAKGHLLDIQNRLNMTFRTVQEQEEYTALEMAIKALESLDKIRAEIEHLPFTMFDKKEVFDRQEVLDIIDKYIGEQE